MSHKTPFCGIHVSAPGGDEPAPPSRPARPFDRAQMAAIEANILSILLARASWSRGTVTMSLEELRSLYLRRFPSQPFPASRPLRALFVRLVRRGQIRWLKFNRVEGMIRFIA